ncbi:MAG: transglycosylase SLT domain-containing protein [Candidatus Competibacteraceae bacterium]
MSCSLAAQAAEQPDWKVLLEKSNPAIQTEWGTRYEHGEGVPQDYQRAIVLYCAAAESGYAGAQYQLGWLYANGRGVSRDDAMAAAWFRLAAAKGDSYAQRMLALVDDPSRIKKAGGCPVTSIVLKLPPPRAKFTLAKFTFIPRDDPGRQQVAAWVNQLAPNYKLDPNLVLALIEIESAFRVNARSPKNALGLMQLIPSTAERFGVQDPFDPLQNLRGGMAYLRWLLAYFQGDVRLALAGYNAGENAVLKYGGIPPYAETQTYVERITRLYGRVTHPPVGLNVAPANLVTSG